MVARIQIPTMLTNDETGATIIYGWSPHAPGMIRYDVNCSCGSNRLELHAPPETRPLDYVWAAVDYHRQHFPDCQCVASTEELSAHLN